MTSSSRGGARSARGRRWARAGVLLALLGSSFPAHASGVDPSKVSLPKGPGSIEGLAAADFSPSLATGSASYDIPIAVPPAALGFGPKLSLAYDSSGGLTELGIGWRVTGTPKLRRRTADGLPRFDDTDTFELVGLGIPSRLVEVSPGLFRPSAEDGSFVRVQRAPGGSTWEARTKAGVTLRFGGDGFAEAEGKSVAAYLLREEEDRHGHLVTYEWDTSEGHALLRRVVWNTFDAASTNTVRFEYEPRPDAHVGFASGIREALTRRLHAVHVEHGGALVRRYELTYGGAPHPTLHAVDLVGKDGTSRMPASRFEYTEATLDVASAQLVTMTDAPGRSPKDPDATLADLDGDGLPDLLVGEAGHFCSYLNHDGKRWLPGADWGSASPSVSLAERGVQLADLDADGAPDLVVKSGTDALRYFPQPTGTRFGAPVSLATVPSFSFEDEDVRLADMDGDRRTDALVTTEAGLAVAYNRGGKDWTEPSIVGKVDAGESVRFSSGRVSLCDVNGDRVEDLCSLRSGGMAYWLGRGRGVFEPGAAARGVPTFDAAAPFQLVDVNGDGWVDLLRVGPGAVEIALAVEEGHFTEVATLGGMPERGPSTAVEIADMNASGSLDIVWADVSDGSVASWRYLELFPDGRAGLLRRIDDGLGKVQTIDYEPAALHAARARDAGNPWKTRLNVAMPVVARTTTDLSLGDPPVVTELSYRDGTYDPSERTLAGFGGGTRTQLGDASTPTLLSDATFDPGLSRRELRGATLEEETRDGAGRVFSHTTHAYTTRALASDGHGGAVSYSFASSELVRVVEGDDAAARTTLTEVDQDAWGNVVAERRWGEVRDRDVLTGNDEAVVQRTFANDESEWLLGFPATEELLDGVGKRVALTRKYYDGEAFRGLPLGQVTRGDVAREEAWVGPGEGDFELVIATKVDADGLPIETRDARGGGRFFEWTPDHAFISSERVKLDGAVRLVERAEADGAFGALVSVTDFAGQRTSYGYDPFGRLARIVKPGDTDALPTAQYTYVPAAPLSRVITESRVVSGRSDVERSELLVDGGGRERGTLTRDGDRWILAGVSLLDARGKVRRTLLPRAVDAAGHAAPPLLDAAPRGTDTFHDAMGREIRTRSPSGIETRTEYAPFETRHWDGGQADAASPYEHTPTLERTDGAGRIVEHVRTVRGRELAARYAYDARGSLLSRTDPEGNVAHYDYDGRGRRVAVHDPDLGVHRFTYDATGNVVARRYPDGKVARFTFDLAGRSLTEDWNDDGTPEIARTWDVAPDGARDASFRGRLSRVVEPGGSVEHAYDARGRVTATRYEIDGVAYVAGSEYDAQDREITHVYPDGSRLAIRHDARGQIAGYGGVVDFDYADDGLEVARRFSTGARLTTGYDDERRRSELTFEAASGATVEHLRWTYDTSGNLGKLTDLRNHVTAERDRSEAYAYDNLYRLTGVRGTWGETSFQYSASGNLTSRTSTLDSQDVRAVDHGTRPHVPTSFDGHAVDLDARGRMTSDGVRKYTWNDIDELVAVSRSDGGAVESIFGDDGVRRQRIEHRPDGTRSTTHFIDAWTEAKDGKLTRYIVHAGQRIVKLAEDSDASAMTADATRTGADATRTGAHATRTGADATRTGAGATRPGAGRLQGARAASATGIGLLCLCAFALTAIARTLLRARPRFPSWASVRAALLAVSVGGGLAVAVTSSAPGTLALGVVLLAALCHAKSARVAAATRALVASIALLAGVAACNGEHAPAADTSSPRDVATLREGDTLIVTDLLGTVLAETTAEGAPRAELATYPFGATRYDTSLATRKYAATPRDAAVGLDHMGARFYAPELALFTSGDPVAVTAPERLVTADFAAANPYAYAKQSPVIHADHDGHFAQLAIGVMFGGGFEAARQYWEHGKIESWGRIGAAAFAGGVSGGLSALAPAAGLAASVTSGAAIGVVAGATQRLIISGGKSVGTLGEVAFDALAGGVMAGVARGAGALIKKFAPTVVNAVRGLGRAGTRVNEIPNRMARVVPAQFAGGPKLAGAGASEAWVTGAEDIADITRSDDIARRLSLVDQSGNLLRGPRAVIEFDAVMEGICSPIQRSNPGFTGRGFTGGGAREFALPNLDIGGLKGVTIRFLE